MPQISVITVVKDHAAGLSRTTDSIKGQDFQDWELIIVVGESTDMTLTTALKIQQTDFRVRVIEQDGLGIYSAMNQGLTAASGEFTWFMNAGDKFFSSMVLRHALEMIRTCPVGLVIGGYSLETLKKNKVYPNSERRLKPYSFAFNRRSGCHQSMLFRTSSIKELGGFDTQFLLASDFDLVLRLMHQFDGHGTSEIFATIEPGGAADRGIHQVYREKHIIRQMLLKGPYVRYLSFAWTVMAKLRFAIKRCIPFIAS